MSLPVYKDPNKNIMDIQTNWAQQLNPVIQLPTNKGLILQNIQLSTGKNIIDHKLSRTLQGWWIVRQRGVAASFYDTQDSNPKPGLTLWLNSSAAVSVDIFVF
jgi:hypothetical protein